MKIHGAISQKAIVVFSKEFVDQPSNYQVFREESASGRRNTSF
jgi:hypothetical protein